jgi:hypothetical protein
LSTTRTSSKPTLISPKLLLIMLRTPRLDSTSTTTPKRPTRRNQLSSHHNRLRRAQTRDKPRKGDWSRRARLKARHWHRHRPRQAKDRTQPRSAVSTVETPTRPTWTLHSKSSMSRLVFGVRVGEFRTAKMLSLSDKLAAQG